MNTDKYRINELLELTGAKLSKWQQWFLEKFLPEKEAEYISMPRLLGEKDDRVSAEQMSETLAKLSKASINAVVAMRGISKSWICMEKTLESYIALLNEEYRKNHPRVVHLAYHAKKARVRKKNQNRIRRMK